MEDVTSGMMKADPIGGEFATGPDSFSPYIILDRLLSYSTSEDQGPPIAVLAFGPALVLQTMTLGRRIVTTGVAVLGCHVTGYAAWMSHVRHPPNLPSLEIKNRYLWRQTLYMEKIDVTMECFIL
jgi:hypothetical protein